jgi:hypothetical protein
MQKTLVDEYDPNMPMPDPLYENHCWNCQAYISDVICEDGGLDPETGEPNGYICNVCGKDLGDFRRRNVN